MDNKALLNEIAKHTTIVEYHIKRLKKKPEMLHEIDVEVLGEKLKELYTLVHSLQTGEPGKKEEVIIVNEVEKVPLVKVEPEPEIPKPQPPIVSERSPEPDPSPRTTDPEPKDSSEFGVGSWEWAQYTACSNYYISN